MTIGLWIFVIIAAPLALGAIVIAYVGMIMTIKDMWSDYAILWKKDDTGEYDAHKVALPKGKNRG